MLHRFPLFCLCVHSLIFSTNKLAAAALLSCLNEVFGERKEFIPHNAQFSYHPAIHFISRSNFCSLDDFLILFVGSKLQVLTNGIEVKLQRNALSVLEPPTGNEEDDDIEFENMQWNGSDMGEFDV